MLRCFTIMVIRGDSIFEGEGEGERGRGEERTGEKRYDESWREVVGLRKNNGENNSINIVGFTRLLIQGPSAPHVAPQQFL